MCAENKDMELDMIKHANQTVEVQASHKLKGPWPKENANTAAECMMWGEA